MQEIILTLWGPLVVGPIRTVRIIRRGSERVAPFRAAHRREPDNVEWLEISHQKDPRNQ
jgi:hypothetical protein